MRRHLLLWPLATLLFAYPLRADNWPNWRGPAGNGVSAEKDIPYQWGPDQNIAWKTTLPGKGHSSPIVWNDAVFVTSAVDKGLAKGELPHRVLMRLDRKTGKIIWERTVLNAATEGIHQLNSYASSTPATDGKRIFVTFLDRNQMLVAAYDFDGNKLWEKRPGEFYSKHGFCTSPLLYKDRLILNGDHDGDAYIVMLRQEDGETVWKIPRENKTRSYCTPIIVPIDGKDQLMLNGSFCTAGYDIETGKRIWIVDGPSEQMVATLVHTPELIFSLGGYPEKHLLAIKKGGKGDITKSHIVWRTHQGIPYVPSPLLYGNLLHVISDEGFYTCFDPPTGKILSRKRACKHTSGSIVGASDRVYITDDYGTTLVLKNSPDCEVLAKNDIGEDVFSSPAISQGNIFLRGAQSLFCIGPKP